MSQKHLGLCLFDWVPHTFTKLFSSQCNDRTPVNVNLGRGLVVVHKLFVCPRGTCRAVTASQKIQDTKNIPSKHGCHGSRCTYGGPSCCGSRESHYHCFRQHSCNSSWTVSIAMSTKLRSITNSMGRGNITSFVCPFILWFVLAEMDLPAWFCIPAK